MRPDINDFVVAFARRDDAFAILLLNFFDFLLRGIDSLTLFLRDDHVINTDGNTGLGRLAEPEFLELVQHDDRLVVAADFVTLPNQVAQFTLLDRFAEETHFVAPDFAEQNATYGGVDHLAVVIAEIGFAVEIV